LNSHPTIGAVPDKCSIRLAQARADIRDAVRSTYRRNIEIINELRGFESASQSTALAAEYSSRLLLRFRVTCS
jgi:hypothetical protein